MSHTRPAAHAGSWYTDDEERLSLQLDDWLDAVPGSAPCIGPTSASGGPAEFPTQGARIIIAPHAGYSYSGKAAAWAYKALDMSQTKRIFILGPSHHFYLTRCALSQYISYATPFGDLPLDHETMNHLQKTGLFDTMSRSVDDDEHSIEMHLPYVYKSIARAFSDYATSSPGIIPILVGNTSPESEKQYGHLLAPYLADPTSIFIISSDFAHWGTRFSYTYYQPQHGQAVNLRAGDRAPSGPKIHESIAAVDMECVDAIESGGHDDFLDVLSRTRNTVCGRHPIGIAMAAMEVLSAQSADGETGKFRFVRYERSSDCVSPRDSSVSYCSGFAVIY